MAKIILTGDRPTGKLHVGHYVGSLKRRVELQNSGNYDKVFIMIADAQALTDNIENPEKVRQNIIEVALDYLSVGLDPSKSTLFIQSQIPELCELSFYYMNLVTVQRLQRNPTVKAEIQLRGFAEGAAEGDTQQKQGIPVGPGRGSGAGSICAYCMGITQIDPLPYHLLFERFLNPERGSMPDFDIGARRFLLKRQDTFSEYIAV